MVEALTRLRHVEVFRSGLEGLRDPLIAYAVKLGGALIGGAIAGRKPAAATE